MPRKEGSACTRRTFLVTSSAVGAAAIAGCQGDTGGTNSTAGTATNATRSDAVTTQAKPLSAAGSSTVYPITSDASWVWNDNPSAGDSSDWNPDQYDVDTDLAMADYFAGRYGFDEQESSLPPFSVNVDLSYSATGLQKVMDDEVAIGMASAPAADVLGDADQSTLGDLIDHVVAIDGQPIVVSRELYDAGVTQLTGEQVASIYRGEVTNWAAVGGPDRAIQAIGRTEGSGSDTAFRANLLGSPDAPMDGVDERKAQNQQVKTVVKNADDAIAYLALAFVDPAGDVPPIALELDGTVYEYGDGLGAEAYPLSRDLHCYTWKDTSMKSAAFIDMLLSDYGQERFVAGNDYGTLPAGRRTAERETLPAADPSV